MNIKDNKTLQAIVEIAGTLSPTLARSVEEATGSLERINIKALAVGAAVAGATVAAVKIGSDAVKSAAAFEKQMSNVATLLDGDVKGRIGELNTEILKVSNSSGIVTADLTDGLYQVISAFGDTADSAKTLEIAAKAAKAGNASTTESINLLSAVTKGYGDTSAEAQQKAADLAFQTVKLGQTSFPELASSIGKVIPLAQTMGIAQEELFGATATLTGVTGNTAEVMTQLRGTVQGFLQPTKQMTDAISALGYADGKTLLESEGLQGALELLKGSVNNNELAFAGLFGSVEAKNAVLALAGAQAENFTEKTQSMYEATGAADKAFVAQTDNLEDIIGKIKNMGANFMTELGMKILPVVKEFAEKALPALQDILPVVADALSGMFEAAIPILQILKQIAPVVAVIMSGLSKLVKWISSTDGAFETLAVILGTITALIIAYNIQQSLVTAGTTLWATVSGAATAATTALGAAFAFLTSPIGLIILAIGALIGIGVLLYKNWDFISEKASELWQTVSVVFGNIGSFISNTFNSVVDVLNNVFGPAFSVIVEYISGQVQRMIDIFRNIIDFVKNVFTGNWKGAWENVKNIFSNIASGIAAAFKAPLNFIIGAINGFLKGINKIEIPDWVPLVGGKGINIPLIPMLASGGFTEGISIAGEAGTEAVISFDPAYRAQNIEYWEQAGKLLGVYNQTVEGQPVVVSLDSLPMLASGGFTEGISIAGEAGTEAVISFDPAPKDGYPGYVYAAGQLFGLEDFSLDDLTETTVNIYNIEWSPHIETHGDAVVKEELMKCLKQHEFEFFDWLENWMARKDVGSFARQPAY